jgi:hypothetical protein
MKNEFLPSRYVETIARLALGIEPIDSQRGGRLPYALQIQHEAAGLGLPRPPIERHTSNLYALRYQPGITTPLQLRFFDSRVPRYRPEYDRRRVVARRFSIQILDRTAVETAEKTDADAVPTEAKDFKRRIRRPFFFPGAAYDFSATTTGMRGRVMRGGVPMRWARVTATLSGTTVVVGRAQGDDRGEFLLLINAAVTTTSAVPKPLQIKVTVTGPKDVPVPGPGDHPDMDPLWDLPVEALAAPGVADLAATGEKIPWTDTKEVSKTIDFPIGKCLTGVSDFVIT